MRARLGGLPTFVLLLGAAYCLFPVAWVVVAATKSTGELFATTTLSVGSSLAANLGELHGYRDGVFWQWMANSALYAGVGALLSAALSGVTGYALAKYSFRGRGLIFNALIAGVLVPAVVLAIPQYLLMSKIGLTDTYLSVLLPSVVSPYGIYLARVYAAAAVPEDVVEAARTDGAGEARILGSIALPMMVPGLVTVFLFQFVSIWNNFMLPYIMLGDDGKFPVTLGLYTMLKQGNTTPALYTLVVTGSLVSVLPLIALFLTLQRYWRIDLLSGAVKA
ncbi:carbohydrate ABC transporter permease [Saccharothrix sp. 6-C]|uniref:Carbohydrate ABC transporter membrane protein 2 (CUT1 family) n=1 Tax=Saccharothrix texasensis TaxID=103734 RepID=A0A3N1H6W5_9PSEU|nr:MULTISPECIES: carbohydrate ABC transporter permease [Saccharothrix]QQQ77441.1 carbohydrate ABC transporter permease [Saccharothrix sp. 6-C]ROP38171.1 carbohydrate ABC transporter membrane protein 2 (CUT1 family) [Saccharothrix texasensis]